DDALYEEAVEEVVEETGRRLPALAAEEEALLCGMTVWAERARHAGDAKGRRLLEWLKEQVKPGGRWSDERVIVFTEFRDTQNWIHGLLAGEGLAEPGRVLRLFGGMTPEDRERVKAAFQAGPRDSEVRILLATDAASEGINLQNHCCKLVHV